MYRIYVTPSARKEAKKLPRSVREAAIQATHILESNAYAGERLTGSLHMLYSLHFSGGGSQYRIAYSVDADRNLVMVHLIQARENFYEKLRRLFH